MTPEAFNIFAVGSGALFVGISAIASVLLTLHNNQKNREQVAMIAAAQAKALERAAADTHEIKLSINGRMDEFMVAVRDLATARAEAIAATTAAALKDAQITDKIAAAVIAQIEAAKVIPKGG